MRCLALALLVACSAGVPAPQRQPRAVAGRQPLGVNDVSILLPLPRDIDRPLLAGVTDPAGALIDRRWFDTLVTTQGDIAPRTGRALAFEDFQVVAVRVDLCERLVIGACPAGTAGRLRLVLQPIYMRAGVAFAHDVALHAFYPIPAVEMSSVVEELRRLSRIRGVPTDAPLSVSPAAAAGDDRYPMDCTRSSADMRVRGAWCV